MREKEIRKGCEGKKRITREKKGERETERRKGRRKKEKMKMWEGKKRIAREKNGEKETERGEEEEGKK